METLNKDRLEHWYPKILSKQLSGRQIVFKDIEPLIKNLSSIFKKEIIGHSSKNIPIYKITIGSGRIKVLTWSQMHGNESTGTKALFDLFNFFESAIKEIQAVSTIILENCSLEFIVMLNPDGAIKFTRENEENIDLNRDAVARKAGESRLLRAALDTLDPTFCFNLHDQRSVYNVEGTKNPATLSFLAPSEDKAQTITRGRKETMSVIVAMNSLLQQVIPGHIGRYTDEFYPTATGDNFQKLGHNTILIEAGHFKDDYKRNITRKFNFFALVQGFYFIATTGSFDNYKPYFDIPNNDKKFLDVIYKNVKVSVENEMKIADVGVQYIFEVNKGEFRRIAHVEKIGDLSDYCTYNWINAENRSYKELELSNS